MVEGGINPPKWITGGEVNGATPMGQSSVTIFSKTSSNLKE